jgi:hypothetical protein
MAAKAVKEVAETVAENVEEVVEVAKQVNEHVLRYFFGGTGLGAVLGFAVGYKFTKDKFREEAKKEVEEVREVYRQKTVALELEKVKDVLPSEIVESKEVSEREGYVQYARPERPLPSPVPVVEPPTSPRLNIFDNPKVEVEEEAEEEVQHINGTPELITYDAFVANDLGYNQTVLTYHISDRTVLDDAGQPVENYADLIGTDFLSHWGFGSKHPDMVYIRNEYLEQDFEICRDHGSHEARQFGMNNDGSE